MIKHPVKINRGGKVILTLSRNQAYLVKPIITRLVEEIANEILGCGGNMPVTRCNGPRLMEIALLGEIHHKYYRELDLDKAQYKMTWSKAQALCFWELSQRYEHVVYCHPVMNNLMFHLHQKIST